MSYFDQLLEICGDYDNNTLYSIFIGDINDKIITFMTDKQLLELLHKLSAQQILNIMNVILNLKLALFVTDIDTILLILEKLKHNESKYSGDDDSYRIVFFEYVLPQMEKMITKNNITQICKGFVMGKNIAFYTRKLFKIIFNADQELKKVPASFDDMDIKKDNDQELKKVPVSSDDMDIKTDDIPDSLKPINDDDNVNCVFCLDNLKTYACVPCGHKVFCETCSQKNHKICPLCRKPIQSVLKIFN